MNYIVMLDGNYANPTLILESDGFVQTYDSYEDAKADGELWKKTGDCQDYAVLVVCTDERNHLV